jgi:hypothetical protein
MALLHTRVGIQEVTYEGQSILQQPAWRCVPGAVNHDGAKSATKPSFPTEKRMETKRRRICAYCLRAEYYQRGPDARLESSHAGPSLVSGRATQTPQGARPGPIPSGRTGSSRTQRDRREGGHEEQRQENKDDQAPMATSAMRMG